MEGQKRELEESEKLLTYSADTTVPPPGSGDDRAAGDHSAMTAPRNTRENDRTRDAATEWTLTPANYPEVDHAIDRDGIFAKAYTESHDGRIVTVGIRIGVKPDHVVARFGDTITRHTNGTVRTATHSSKR